MKYKYKKKSKASTIALMVLMPISIATVTGSILSVRHVYNSTCSESEYQQLYKQGFNDAIANSQDYQSKLEEKLQQKNDLVELIALTQTYINEIESQITATQQSIDNTDTSIEENQILYQTLQSELDTLESNLKTEQTRLEEYKTIYEEKNQDGTHVVIFKVEDKVYNGQVVDSETTPCEVTIEDTATRRFVGWRTKDSSDLVDPTTIPVSSDTTYYAVFNYAYNITYQYFDETTTILTWDNEPITPPEVTLPSGYTSYGWKDSTGSIVDLNTIFLTSDLTLEYSYTVECWNYVPDRSFTLQPNKTINLGQYDTTLDTHLDCLNLSHAKTAEISLDISIWSIQQSSWHEKIVDGNISGTLTKQDNCLVGQFVLENEIVTINLFSTSSDYLILNIYTEKNDILQHRIKSLTVRNLKIYY